jgi:hypothetical protein
LPAGGSPAGTRGGTTEIAITLFSERAFNERRAPDTEVVRHLSRSFQIGDQHRVLSIIVSDQHSTNSTKSTKPIDEEKSSSTLFSRVVVGKIEAIQKFCGQSLKVSNPPTHRDSK